MVMNVEGWRVAYTTLDHRKDYFWRRKRARGRRQQFHGTTAPAWLNLVHNHPRATEKALRSWRFEHQNSQIYKTVPAQTRQNEYMQYQKDTNNVDKDRTKQFERYITNGTPVACCSPLKSCLVSCSLRIWCAGPSHSHVNDMLLPVNWSRTWENSPHQPKPPIYCVRQDFDGAGTWERLTTYPYLKCLQLQRIVWLGNKSYWISLSEHVYWFISFCFWFISFCFTRKSTERVIGLQIKLCRHLNLSRTT